MEKVPPIPGESLPKFSINSVQTGTKSYISQIPAISSTTDDHYTVTDNQSNFVSSSEQPLPPATQNLNTAFSDAVQKDNCWTPSIFLPIGINDEVIDIIPFLSSGSKPSNFPRGAVLCIGHFPDSDSMRQFIKEKALTGGTKLLSRKSSNISSKYRHSQYNFICHKYYATESKFRDRFTYSDLQMPSTRKQKQHSTKKKVKKYYQL